MSKPAARVADPISCGDNIAQGSGDVMVNGLPAARQHDMTAGHGCYPPTTLKDGSGVVFVNNRPFSYQSIEIVEHCCDDDCHDGAVSVASPDVFVGEVAGSVAVANVEKHIAPTSPSELDFRYQVSCDMQQDGDTAAYVNMKNVSDPDPKRQPNPDDEMSDEVDNKPPPKPPANIPTDCEDIFSHQGAFPGTFQLSPNFTLSQLTTNTLVSSYSIRSQKNLTEAEIVCNLRQLCVNVLEPMKAEYGSAMRVNSGFRHGNVKNSQHYFGQAVDISFTDVSGTEGNYNRAVEIRDNFNYDQLIFEQNNSIWFHVSYNAKGNRRVVYSKPRGNKFYPGLRKIKS